MTQAGTGRFIATIDTANLQTLRWGLMRQFFPRFAEEIELGRYVRTLLTSGGATAVHIEHHHTPNGGVSEHIFDVYEIAA